MRLGFLFAATVTLGWLSASAPASACKCAVGEPTEYYRSAEHVLHVKVVELVQRDDLAVTYRAELLEDDFKGCLRARAQVLLSTASDSAACGVALPVGGEALVYAHRVEDDHADDEPAELPPDLDGPRFLAVDRASEPTPPTLTTNSCSGTTAWSEVTAQLRDFLVTRPRHCGGTQTCEAKPVVQCFVDPCAVSTCEVAGAVCQSSYCGGCNARWFAEGARVCAPAPACRYNDPGRRYVARSPEGCKVVRFACQDGEEMFFDACGCGCARA